MTPPIVKVPPAETELALGQELANAAVALGATPRENFLERASRSQTAGVILEEFKTANSEEEILISPFIGLFGS